MESGITFLEPDKSDRVENYVKKKLGAGNGPKKNLAAHIVLGIIMPIVMTVTDAFWAKVTLAVTTTGWLCVSFMFRQFINPLIVILVIWASYSVGCWGHFISEARREKKASS